MEGNRIEKCKICGEELSETQNNKHNHEDTEDNLGGGMSLKGEKVKKVTINRVEGETEQQYTAWILYCQMGTMAALMRQWERIYERNGKVSEETEGFREKLGKPVTKRLIEHWSHHYRWVERTDKKISEDMKILLMRTQKIKREKIHRLAEIFSRASKKVLKRMKGDEEPTVNELKQMWEMFQVEIGKPTSRSALQEEQKNPTEEDDDKAEKLDEAIKTVIKK